MLRPTDVSTHLRVHQLNQFADIAHMARAHLGDKHLMGRRELFADDAGHAHRRIEARRRGQHVVFDRQNIAQQKLRARLAIAAVMPILIRFG